MSKRNTLLSKNALPDNVIDLKHNETNIVIDDEIVSIGDLEKIFFLSKLNPDPAFISSVLKIDVKKIDSIIHSCNFQQIVNEYLSEYMAGEAGEQPEQLTLRYKDLLQECFTSIRVSIGLRIRKGIEEDKPVDGKSLNIPLIEKLMRLEFALHGLPIDLKGVFHSTQKDTKDKSNDELLESLNGIKDTIERAGNPFNPNEFISKDIIDVPLKDDNGDSDNNGDSG